MITIEIYKRLNGYEVLMNIDGHTHGATQSIAHTDKPSEAILKALHIKKEIEFINIEIDKATAKDLKTIPGHVKII